MYSAPAKTIRLPTSAKPYATVSRARRVATSLLQDVAHTAHRGDKLPRMLGINLLAQVVDDHVDDVGARIEVIAPRILGDERAAHDAPAMPREILQHGVLLVRQLDALAGPAHLTRGLVNLEIPNVQ